MGHVGLIIKATRLCNLRCTYCHEWATGPNQTMRFPVLARLISETLTYPDHNVIDFMWHGGETTVLPMAYYEKAMLVQARFRRSGQRIRNIIQTNATRLTPEWARFLRENRFTVGVSIDGPPENHDKYRRYVNGRPSFDDVVRGINLLREHRVPFGVLMVVDQGVLDLGPDRVFDFIVEHNIWNIGFCSAKPTNQPDALPGTPTVHYTDPVTMNAFMTRIYDRWLEHGNTMISIREISAINASLAHDGPVACTLAGGCLGTYFVVEPNGDMAHCDLFLGDPGYDVGNIMRDSFTAIKNSINLQRLKEQNEHALSQMRGCPEFEVCNGWCPHERYLSVRHNPAHRSDCCGLRDLISHIKTRQTEARQPAEPALQVITR